MFKESAEAFEKNLILCSIMINVKEKQKQFFSQ